MIFSIKYTILRLVRNRSNLFWILCFPIVLGTLFKAAFSNLDTADQFQPIPVAVVGVEASDDIHVQTFRETIDTLSKKGDDQMLDVTICDKKKAMKLLEEKKIDGILTCDENIRLTISANMKNSQTNQSILKAFVDQYNIDEAILTDTAIHRPEQMPQMITKMTENISYREEVNYAYHDTGSYTQYFYNLIAMACLYTAIGGVVVTLENQGNLTTIAARKNVSASKKGVSIAGELIATIFVEFILNLLGFLFIIYILKIDMNFRMGLTILAILVSTMTGITLGFFIGSIGKKSQDFKIGMVFAVVMPCCFLSGLMVGNMRMIVEHHAPWFNYVNPAALISDCFYSLTAYESLNRYYTNLLTLCAFTVIFTLGGIILTRRNRYASL